MQKTPSRIPAVDAARGIAIVMMVIFHLVYDLNVYYGLESLRFSEGFWAVFGKSAAVLFFLIFGISGVLAHKKYGTVFAKRSAIKGLKLLLLASVITVVSFVIEPDRPIYFGVLHFLGISALFIPLFIRFREMNIGFAVCCFFIGLFTQSLRNGNFFLLPVGIRPYDFESADYFPLFPWFTFILIGIFLGKVIPLSKLKTPFKGHSPILSPLAFAGRHSLLIYFVHQPVIIGLLALFKQIQFF